MRLKQIMFLAAVIVVVFTACSKNKQTKDIITTKPVEQASSSPEKMQDSNYQETVDWIGKQYTVRIRRHSNENLPMIVDTDGKKYYDNNITVSIIRPDKTVFFDKTFSKSDFSSYISADYMKKSALLGIVFDEAVGDNLIFAASVGSPDVLSDEYIPLMVTVSRMGNISIKKDNRLDTDNSQLNDDYGV